MTIADVNKAIIELKSNKNINLQYSDIEPELDSYSLGSIQRKGFDLKEDKVSAYNEANGISFYWQDKKNIDFGGETSIQQLEASLWAGWTNKLWFDNSKIKKPYVKEYDAFCRNLYGMDVMERSMDSTRIVAFYIDKTKLKPEDPFNPDLWVFNADDVKYKLTLNFEQYLEKLLITKGFIGWQLFYLDWDGMDFKDPVVKNWLFSYAPSTTEMEEFIEYMPKIFPKQDYTEFQKLYDNWIKKAKKYGFKV